MEIFCWKYFEIKPIIITLPQVKSVTECKPIKRSVIKKLPIKTGNIYDALMVMHMVEKIYHDDKKGVKRLFN